MNDKREIKSRIHLELKEDVTAGQLVELLNELNDAVETVLNKHKNDDKKTLINCLFIGYKG